MKSDRPGIDTLHEELRHTAHRLADVERALSSRRGSSVMKTDAGELPVGTWRMDLTGLAAVLVELSLSSGAPLRDLIQHDVGAWERCLEHIQPVEPNAEALRLLAATEQKSFRHRFAETFGSGDASESLKGLITTLCAGQNRATAETRITDPDGGIRFVHLTLAVPLSLASVTAVAVDVTAQRAPEFTYRHLFDLSGDPHLLVDADGIVDCNEPAVARLGCADRNILLSLSPVELSPEVQPSGAPSESRFAAHLEACFKGEPQRFEWTHVGLDDSQFVVDVTMRGLKVDGRDAALVAWRDITTRAERERDLRSAVVKAANADRAKSAFLANVSHEIRTPMNGIIGMTGLLLSSRLSAQQREFAGMIRQSGEVLLTLINTILDFARIESGSLELECEEFALRDCVESSLELVAQQAADKDIELAYFMEPDVPWSVVADATRVRQVLVNLVGNGVKFTDGGHVRVDVGFSQSLPSAGRLEFQVSDTGIGIAAEKQATLFAPFTQVDSASTRRFDGTGLGLAITKQLVEVMGGEITVRSEVGEGSVFRCTMQVDLPDAEAAEGDLRSRPPLLTGSLVIVVVRNEILRESLMRQALDCGCDARAADSVAAGRELVESAASDTTVIIDAALPRNDADPWLVELAASGVAVPVLLTGLTLDRASGTIPVGVKRLLKPVKSAALRELVHSNKGSMTMSAVEVPAGAGDPTFAQKHPLRILIAEDNVVNQMVAMGVLEQLGYRSDMVANGREALDALRRQPYDIVLMDVQMPELDGLAATRIIHEEWKGKPRPWIIAMTANARPSDRDEYLAGGMDDYLSKPWRLSELRAALLRHARSSADHRAS